MARSQCGMTVGRTALHVVYHVTGKEQKTNKLLWSKSTKHTNTASTTMDAAMWENTHTGVSSLGLIHSFCLFAFLPNAVIIYN